MATDDDVRLGNKQVVAHLVEPLLKEKSIGVTSASIRVPQDATKFQRCYAREIPHCQSPIVDEIIDVWAATSAACAIRKEVFFEIGKFNEDIPRGVDPEFSYRIRKFGYRTVLVPRAWCYHLLPKNVNELMRVNWRNGWGAAYVDTYFPDLNIDLDPRGVIYPSQKKSAMYRCRRFCIAFLRAVINFRLLLILVKVSYACGYGYGIIKYSILKYCKRNVTDL